MPLNKPGRSGGILPYLFLYIPVVWAALLIAQSLGDDLPELLMNLTAALQTPLKIHWTGHSLMSILACTGLYVMGICLYRTTQGRTRDGEEHGSAQWASPKQVNAMFCQKQNKPLTQNVRLGLDTTSTAGPSTYWSSAAAARPRPAAMSCLTFWRPTPTM